MKKNDFYYYISITATGVLLLIGCIVYVYWFQDRIAVPECLIHKLTGWYCPACGGTRAVFSLFSGNFIESIFYHPVVVYAVAVWCLYVGGNALILLLTHKKERMVPLNKTYVLIGILLFVVNFVIKNVYK